MSVIPTELSALADYEWRNLQLLFAEYPARAMLEWVFDPGRMPDIPTLGFLDLRRNLIK